jgi:predicted nucleic-acid-binding Zn-ribbon protein
MGLFSKPEPEAVKVAGRVLTCLICGHARFNKREAQLHTSGMTFINLDFLNACYVAVVCDKCGFIHWFVANPANSLYIRD